VHSAPIVAVGGTNGKSTVTSLLAAILSRAGKQTFAGGNLGEPLADHADEKFDAIVLEVSSYQMERVATFHPQVAVLLNVTPDHLDRYADVGAYATAKGNCFLRQREADYAIIPFGDAVCTAQAKRGAGQLLTFGEQLGSTVRIADDTLFDTRDGENYLRADMQLQGGHNALNVASAICAARAMGVSAEVIRAELKVFQGLAHRVEFVCDVGGIRYYDDSKGTNVGAAVTAVRGLREAKAVLIAGGRDKGGSYGPLVEAMRAKGRALVLIGEAAELIEHAFGELSALPRVKVNTMHAAVSAAAALAQPGDAVLLSPACSSFDMFRDYKERGDAFAKCARGLGAATVESFA
jgi:UDP-N-acetylmuramoylalanine--D-glutamate ligase